MNIGAKKGTKIIFTGKGGYDYENKRANQILTVGETYTVDFTNINNWSTEVILEEFPKERFNSVLFDDIE